jgi:hypothetical protein
LGGQKSYLFPHFFLPECVFACLYVLLYTCVYVCTGDGTQGLAQGRQLFYH